MKASFVPDGGELDIYTVSAELVRQCAPSAGMAQWDGRSSDGTMVASGTYYYVIRLGNQALSRGPLIVRRR